MNAAFRSLPLAGAFAGRWGWLGDERGRFARAWCSEAFRDRGVAGDPVQANLSDNRLAGTLRGLHLQVGPHAEAKLVAALRGRAWDVGLDTRPDSPTRGAWAAVEIGGPDADFVFWPAGIAHGFQTLEDDTWLHYLMWAPYHPASARGFDPLDPGLALPWPRPITVMSDRDRAWPRWSAAEGG